MTSSGRSSFTAVHTISATHPPEDGSHSPFDKKPMSSNQTLTFYEYRSDDLSTGRKTRF
ncbi:hypothetical protein CU098_001838, partial [Rhizopus stolonifer]